MDWYSMLFGAALAFIPTASYYEWLLNREPQR